MLNDVQLQRLRQIAGSDNLLTDSGSLENYGQDRTRYFNPAPSAVIFARNISQLTEIVRSANDERLALVPSGGRTGLSGGAVACNGEIVISFDRMNRILSFNAIDQTVTLEAGVITRTL